MHDDRSQSNPSGPGVAAPQQVDIFVAENNEINHLYVETILGNMGRSFQIFPNGEEIVRAYRWHMEHRVLPKAILMDIAMPICDGVEATKRIRAMESDFLLPSTPILALTANAVPGLREIYLASGMDDYLLKPYSPAQLVEKLASWSITTDAAPLLSEPQMKADVF